MHLHLTARWSAKSPGKIGIHTVQCAGTWIGTLLFLCSTWALCHNNTCPLPSTEEARPTGCCTVSGPHPRCCSQCQADGTPNYAFRLDLGGVGFLSLDPVLDRLDGRYGADRRAVPHVTIHPLGT